MIRDPAAECAPRAELERLQSERLGATVRWCAERVPF
jgi:phenylacetate-coenzyme A ligase PaaK-like adenylate-forming protein